MADFDFDSSFETAGGVGLDGFLADSEARTAAESKPRMKVASLTQLKGFVRLSHETLVNKSTRDLWALKKDGGEFYIERLFQDDGSPVKG